MVDGSVAGNRSHAGIQLTAEEIGQEKGKASDAASSNTTGGGGESVEEMMRRLNLTSKEATPLILDDEGDDDLSGPEWALVGKVLAPNVLHVNTITAVVRPAWGNPKGLVVRPMGDNLFLAEFRSEADKIRVAKGGPWCLNKHAILLKDFDARIKPEHIIFDRLTVWAHIMNLGYEMMNSERGTSLAARLGEVDHVEVDENGRAWGSYLRVRVTIDATQPVMRCVSVFSRKRNMMMQFNVMYERLPLFCYSCGLLGHSSIVCPTLAERDADGLLPYNGDRILVPDRKKKEQAFSDHSQSGRNSRTSTGQGSGTKAAAPHGVQKSTRARKPTVPRKGAKANLDREASSSAAHPDADRVTGQKRKQMKQVYVPRTLSANQPSSEGAGALVLVGEYLNPEGAHIASVDASAENSVDSFKKQKTISRSADPVAAALQPRQAQ